MKKAEKLLQNNVLEKKGLIALDADGVLLDYNTTYGKIWHLHFNEILNIKEPTAYHSTTYWGVENPPKTDPFWDSFDEHGWMDMAPMEGAVEACHRLVDAGYELVCVTSMPAHRMESRLTNLRNLGFPIKRVIATGTLEDKTINPKKKTIEKLMPLYFVDDELRKLKELPSSVNCVLIDPGHIDSPNEGQDASYLFKTVETLLDFAKLLVPEPRNKKISLPKP